MTDNQVIESANNEPTKVLLMQLVSTLCAYIFGKFACKVRIQLESFALPIMLVGPATLGGVVSLCHYRQVDPCSLEPTIPDHIFYKVLLLVQNVTQVTKTSKLADPMRIRHSPSLSSPKYRRIGQRKGRVSVFSCMVSTTIHQKFGIYVVSSLLL